MIDINEWYKPYSVALNYRVMFKAGSVLFAALPINKAMKMDSDVSKVQNNKSKDTK